MDNQGTIIIDTVRPPNLDVFRFNNIGANCQYNSFLQLFAYNKLLVNFKNNSTLISVQNKVSDTNQINITNG